MTAGLRRRFFVPEVVQTSLMDCGPAALKCLLEGWGGHASYGRLREACQTDIDGTSIDALEEAAVQLGLDAEQLMVPADHVLLAEAAVLPALAVIRRPDGNTHFVVIWSRHGRWVQLMDPGVGRRFGSARALSADLYLHTASVGAAEWRQWAATEEFIGPLARRLRLLGIGAARVRRQVAAALEDPSWRSLAALDAATRMVTSLERARGVRGGKEAEHLVTRLTRTACASSSGTPIADGYWTARPADAGPDGGERLLLRGAVLLRVKGTTWHLAQQRGRALSPELRAAAAERPPQAARMLWTLLGGDGGLLPCAVGLAIVCASAAIVFQAVLFQALFDLLPMLTAGWQRAAAVAVVAGFAALPLAVDLSSKRVLLRLGRRLEARLRVALFEKLPKLGDRYFRSRLASDMAQRSHSIHTVHLLPLQAGRAAELVATLLLTGAAIAVFSPRAAWIAIAATLSALGIPLAFQPILSERDLRATSQSARLSILCLDALLGLLPIRLHSADRAMSTEHEMTLTDFCRATRAHHRAALWAEGLESLAGAVAAIAIVAIDTAQTRTPGRSLLLAYWALSLPALGQELALLLRQYPTLRNRVLRLTEPLGAIEDQPAPSELRADPAPAANRPAPAIAFDGVTVRASGHVILDDLSVRIGSREHIAVVGRSGAGKSTLLGLLLGFHRPHTGTLTIDGRPLDDALLAALRRDTVWVDPEVQLWSTSLLENVLYGNDSAITQVGDALRCAELYALVEQLPQGLQTQLGEGGALCSGGQAQRIRFARGLLRAKARLVLLDEPFRGLERALRKELLRRARQRWQDATLVCVTHDLAQAEELDRVVVVEAGQIAEVGAPKELLANPRSRFRALSDAQDALDEQLQGSTRWRRLRLEAGRLVEEAAHGL